jgi:hypothetical protein
MIPKEYQKSNLALELKPGKKRLEDALHVLSDAQRERAGGTRSGSVRDVLSELVATELAACCDHRIGFLLSECPVGPRP